MDDESTERQSELDEEMLRIVKRCIKVLLTALEARLADQLHDNPDESIGKIQIVIDEQGDICKLLGRQRKDRKNGVFVIQVPSQIAANAAEFALAEWAYSPKAIAAVIAEIDPRYMAPEWAHDLEIATEEVAEVLVGAIVIRQDSPIHMSLQQAANAPRSEKRRPMLWFSN